MSAYIIVEIAVTDPATYEQYKVMTPPSIARYGGRYLVRGAPTELLEGSWKPPRLVILEFPSSAHARSWWSSEEDGPAKSLRQASASSEMLLVEGVSPNL